MKEATVAAARQKICLQTVLALGVVKSSYFTALTAFHTVITDKNLPDKWKG